VLEEPNQMQMLLLLQTQEQLVLPSYLLAPVGYQRKQMMQQLRMLVARAIFFILLSLMRRNVLAFVGHDLLRARFVKVNMLSWMLV
jgi:hypothetical protein